MPQETMTNKGKVSGYRGAEAGKEAKYSELEEKKERDLFYKEKGYGIGKLPKPGEYEAWKKKRREGRAAVQASALKPSPSPAPSPTPPYQAAKEKEKR